ncbi:DUF6804 family protein [Tenacibaculum aiptasiae]|uniref:DUF6804 family protein n=1 Tax=Tenacibaculum aiptasiae TaxID=426481 RepID=UPI00233142C2|nr:DUF6804 family protein [Tenacibaculum aiptasiae]
MGINIPIRIAKTINIICAILLFIALLNLPIKYYRFLRTVIFIGSLLVILNKDIKLFWKLTFLPIALLFNPIFPVYLYFKSYWMPLDIISGVLFLLIVFLAYESRKELKKEKKTKQKIKNRNMYKVKY